MRKLYLSFWLTWVSVAATAQAGHLVISQVYGGGGNVGAPLKNDFVEIFNPSPLAVTFTNWSIQYASALSTGTWNDVATISGTIPPGGYYLVQLQGGATGANLPAADAVNTNINLSAINGKVALVSHNTPLNGACPANGVVDFVGYGSANCSETSSASEGSNSLALIRISCRDSDHNTMDFVADTPNPRNSSAPLGTCDFTYSIITKDLDAPFCINATAASGVVHYTAYGNYNTIFTAYLSDASGSFANPLSIGSVLVNGTDPSGLIPVSIPAGTAGSQAYKIRVTANVPQITGSSTVFFSIVNGVSDISQLTASFTETTVTLNWNNPSNCFDEIMITAKTGGAFSAIPTGDGSGYISDLNFTGAGTSFNGGKVVYKGTVSGQTITGLTEGVSYRFKLFTRKDNFWSNGSEITIMPRLLPSPGDILINQLSPGYAGASDEYIELVNKTNHIFNLADLAIRYQSTSGTSGMAGGTLSGILLARQFWLLSPNETLTVGANVGTQRDGAILAGMAASSGQVALVRTTDNVIIDAVGYGNITGGNFTEVNPVTTPPANGGLKRRVDGYDTNNNSMDFETVANHQILLRTRFHTVLPLRFEWIKATLVQQKVQIQFKVREENEVLEYLIERSINGGPFQKAGNCKAAHSTQQNLQYTYTESKPIGEWVVYRIKAMVKDGSIDISKIVGLNVKGELVNFKAVHDRNKSDALNISGIAVPGEYQIVLNDINGHVWLLKSFRHAGGSFEERVSILRLPAGIYVVQLRRQGQTLRLQKIIIH